MERTQGLFVGRETSSSLAGKWILPEAQVLVSSVAVESSVLRIAKREWLTLRVHAGCRCGQWGLHALAGPDPILLYGGRYCGKQESF